MPCPGRLPSTFRQRNSFGVTRSVSELAGSGDGSPGSAKIEWGAGLKTMWTSVTRCVSRFPVRR